MCDSVRLCVPVCIYFCMIESRLVVCVTLLFLPNNPIALMACLSIIKKVNGAQQSENLQLLIFVHKSYHLNSGSLKFIARFLELLLFLVDICVLSIPFNFGYGLLICAAVS